MTNIIERLRAKLNASHTESPTRSSSPRSSSQRTPYLSKPSEHELEVVPVRVYTSEQTKKALQDILLPFVPYLSRQRNNPLPRSSTEE